MNPTRRFFALSALAAITVAGSAEAATYTWDGGHATSTAWSQSANWDAAVVTGSTTDLVFTGTTRTTNTNTLANGSVLRSITFDANAGAFTLNDQGSNRIDFDGEPAMSIIQDSANPQNINLNIANNNAANFVVGGSGTGLVTFGSNYAFGNSGGAGAARNLVLEGGFGITYNNILRNRHGTSGTTYTLGLVLDRSTSTATVRTTNTNSYTGTTAINEGVLLVNNSHTGGDNYTVAGGGTLGGTGTITPAASKSITLAGDSLSSRAVLAPGDAVIESLQIGSSTTATTLDLGTFSTLAIDLDASTADVIDMFGTVNLNDTRLALTITGSPAVNQLYTIINNDGVADGYTKAGSYSGLFTYGGSQLGEGDEFVASGTTFKISYVGNDGNDVTLSVVPEPSALAVLSLAGLALGRRRRCV